MSSVRRSALEPAAERRLAPASTASTVQHSGGEPSGNESSRSFSSSARPSSGRAKSARLSTPPRRRSARSTTPTKRSGGVADSVDKVIAPQHSKLLPQQFYIEQGLAGLQTTMPPEPVVVKAVAIDGWAESVGISTGDVIVALDGEPTPGMSREHLIKLIKKKRPLVLDIARRILATTKDDLGFSCSSGGHDSPVIVESVWEGSWAASRGVSPGLELMLVNSSYARRLRASGELDAEMSRRPLGILFLPACPLSGSCSDSHTSNPFKADQLPEGWEYVLPEGWEHAWSNEHNRYYYFNCATGERTCKSPMEIREQASNATASPLSHPEQRASSSTLSSAADAAMANLLAERRARRAALRKSRQQRTHQSAGMKQQFDLLLKLPPSIREQCLAFCSLHELRAARVVDHSWADSVVHSMFPDERERCIYLALCELLYLPWNWISHLPEVPDAEHVPRWIEYEIFRPLLQKRILLEPAAPYVREFCAKCLALFDACVPAGEMDRKDFGRICNILKAIFSRCLVKAVLLGNEKGRPNLVRAIYSIVMRKTVDLQKQAVRRLNDEQSVAEVSDNPSQSIVFGALDWYAGNSGTVKRADVNQMLKQLETVLIGRSPGALSSALDKMMKFLNDLCHAFCQKDIREECAMWSLTLARFFSSGIRYLFDLLLDSDVQKAYYNSVPFTDYPPALQKLMEGQNREIIDRQKWVIWYSNILRASGLVSWFWNTCVPFITSDNMNFHTGHAGSSFESFLEWFGIGVSEATFVEKITPRLENLIKMVDDRVELFCSQMISAAEPAINEEVKAAIKERQHMLDRNASRLGMTAPRILRNVKEDEARKFFHKVYAPMRNLLVGFVPRFASHLFHILDIDNDGSLSSKELARARVLVNARDFDEFCNCIFDVADVNGDGKLQLSEFVEFQRKMFDVLITTAQLLLEICGMCLAEEFRSEDSTKEYIDSARTYYDEIKVEEVRVYELGFIVASALMRVGSDVLETPWLLGIASKCFEIQLRLWAATDGSKDDDDDNDESYEIVELRKQLAESRAREEKLQRELDMARQQLERIGGVGQASTRTAKSPARASSRGIAVEKPSAASFPSRGTDKSRRFSCLDDEEMQSDAEIEVGPVDDCW